VAEQHDLYFKLSKCTFHASSIDYLGVIIEKGMTRMDPVKIAGIKNWPIPTKVKDVRSFLGFCNFYRPFIRGFAHLARPLNELTRKDAEWSWEDRQQKAFDVTDLQGPPSGRTPEEKLWDFKKRAQQYARDQGSCDDTRISYLEFVELEAEADLTLARMIAG
jgi:hypothetical protein